MNTKTLELTKSQAQNLAEFIAWDIFSQIRNDESIDNINWLCDMCDIYRVLEKVVSQFDAEGVKE